MSTIAERHTKQHFKAKAEAAMPKTYEEMLNEIRNFKPLRGPELAPGVPGHLHFPRRVFKITYTNWGEWRTETVDCGCGTKLDRSEFTAPSNQPAPSLWAGLEAFKQHILDEQFNGSLKAIFATEGKENA